MMMPVFLGHPYITASIAPLDEDSSLFTVQADPTSGRFEATSHLDISHGIPRNVSAMLSAVTPLAPGCSVINATFKLSIGHFTTVFVVPGPGYVAATCGFDLLATRRDAAGTLTNFPVTRFELVHAWIIFVAPIGGLGTVPPVLMNPTLRIQLDSGVTGIGEVWSFGVRAWAETGGGGFFVPGATAQVTGSLHGIRVSGV